MINFNRRTFAGLFIATMYAMAVSGLVILVSGGYLSTRGTNQVVRLVALKPTPGIIVLSDVGHSSAVSIRGLFSDSSIGELDQDYLSFESTDNSVVRVSADGRVDALAQGTAEINVTFGSLEKSVRVIVIGNFEPIPEFKESDIVLLGEPGSEVEVVGNRVIVVLDSRYEDDYQRVAANVGGDVIFSYDSLPLHLIEFDVQQKSLQDVLNTLGSDPAVVAVSPDLLLYELDHDIDTLALNENQRLAYDNSGISKAWRILESVPDLSPVSVVLFDSGLPDDSELQTVFDVGRISNLYLGISGNHAFGVASVIVARNDASSGTGVVSGDLSGVVSSVETLDYVLYSHNMYNSLLKLSLANWIRFMHWITNNREAVDVVNMSYGGRGLPAALLLDEELIQEANSVTFVTGAGNCSRPSEDFIPARYSLTNDNVITAGGVNDTYDNRYYHPTEKCELLHEMWPWEDKVEGSSYGDAVTVGAPWRVYVANPGPVYGMGSGTSYSAPLVSGTVALLKAIAPDLSPGEIRDVLVDTGDVKLICRSNNDLGNCPDSDEESWPFLRADKAVTKLLSDRVSAAIDTNFVVPSSNNKVVGYNYDVASQIINTGVTPWGFYVEAEFRLDANTLQPYVRWANNVVAENDSHPFYWGFTPLVPGCWDIRVRVWMDPNDANETSYLRNALAELIGMNSNDESIGLLADSGWIQDVLEVRTELDADIDCAGENQVRVLPGLDAGPGAREVGVADVMLLADTSGSMDGEKIRALRESVSSFVQRMYDIRLQSGANVADLGAYLGLIDFDDYFRELISLDRIGSGGTNLQVWDEAISYLDSDGGTALYDAVIESVKVLETRKTAGRPSILIALTDGEDTESRSSLQDAIDAIGNSGIIVLAMGFQDDSSGDFDFDVLQALARAGNGEAYIADPSNLEQMYLLFSTVFELRP